MEEEFRKFLTAYELKVAALSKSLSVSYFNATISGKKEDYDTAAELQVKLSRIYSDKEDFEQLKKFKQSGQITDILLARQLELIYNEYASYQFDDRLMEEIIKLSSSVEEKFSTFRVKVNGEELTDNNVDDILITSTDTDELEAIWKASKQIGRVVVDDVIKLAEMRNESARMLGFSNYYEMSLTLNEQNPERVEKLFDDLDALTADAFAELKNEMDIYLANRLSLAPEKLMPWHYQDRFFQNGPQIYKVDLDSYFTGKDLIALTIDYYRGIGLDIKDLVAKSDLFEKEGKYQHAYCTDIDREGDIRVVCNIKPNYKWMGTMLHEYGHAVYDKYIDKSLPWELRTHAHIFTTEAIAMFFGRLASNTGWLRAMLGIAKEECEKIESACFNSFRLEQLVFSRWVQVMFRFEKGMYENPRQDLNALWWALVEKYQLIKKPEGRDEPDWASKIHVALYPAYYHNYMLGELLASQFHFYILNNIPGDGFLKFVNNISTGNYFRNEVFKPGAKMRWDELIKYATGEALTPKYYALQMMNKL
jgi:peptidyl-dipeptidase A